MFSVLECDVPPIIDFSARCNLQCMQTIWEQVSRYVKSRGLVIAIGVSILSTDPLTIYG